MIERRIQVEKERKKQLAKEAAASMNDSHNLNVYWTATATEAMQEQTQPEALLNCWQKENVAKPETLIELLQQRWASAGPMASL